MSRRRTRLAAWLALLAVFFAQLATAAYACPHIEAALKAPPSAEQVAVPCEQMGMDKSDGSGLCFEHCKVGLQLVDTHPTVDHSPQTSALVFVVATFVADASTRSPFLEPLLARATAPPIYASSSRLRI